MRLQVKQFVIVKYQRHHLMFGKHRTAIADVECATEGTGAKFTGSCCDMALAAFSASQFPYSRVSANSRQRGLQERIEQRRQTARGSEESDRRLRIDPGTLSG
jgi:hypothetical protein